MAAITLTSLVCNNTANPVRDGIILRRNGTKIATFDFVDLEVQPLSFAADSNDSIELVVKINSTGLFRVIGNEMASVNPSPISYRLGSSDYSLNYV